MGEEVEDGEGLKTTHSNKIVIGLCTYHRNWLLGGALESLSRIDLPSEVTIEFVLVDNDPAGGAKPVFEAYVGDFPFGSHYFVEPNQGLAYARNRVLEEAIKLGATEIAFFDDDEIVTENWLTALWNSYLESPFGGVGGPAYRLLLPKHDVILEKFWRNLSNRMRKDKYLISTNNCLFSANLVDKNGLNLRFDPFFNQIGGEDAKFALEACIGGAQFSFVKEAVVVERFTEERATFFYLFKRHFGGGSLPPLIIWRLGMARSKRRILLCILSCMWRTAFIPLSLCFGKFQFWKNLFYLAEATGCLVGHFGFSYRYYKPKASETPKI
ncbi:MAG: glycosyltransferase family 2 protein [Puniceicoccales bacterium]|jgi:glycosyltransferase involved in cell wall biosynthesis|nr:glycosyltransferase family 2 protein [Puniceicoccales bacterium]